MLNDQAQVQLWRREAATETSTGAPGWASFLYLQLHEMTARASAPDLAKSSIFERGYKTHEAITRRIWVYRVSLDYRGAV